MGVGDNVMALSALRSFRYDEFSIGWICKSDSTPLLKNIFPNSFLFTIERKKKSRVLIDLKYYLLTCYQIIVFLKKYDCKKAIIFDYKELPVALFAILGRIAGVPEIYSCCDKSKRNIFLTETLPMFRYRDVHEVERYKEMFALVLEPTKEIKNIILSLPSSENVIRKHNGKMPGNSVVALAPGSDRSFKRWHIEKWIELALRLTKQGKHILLLGGSNDTIICDSIVDRLPDGSASNFAGITDLIESTALMKNVDLLVTNDSALMHLADFIGVKVIGLFGITRPQRCGPYHQMNNVVIAASSESGTYRYGRFKKWDDACINTISVEMVWDKIQEVTCH